MSDRTRYLTKSRFKLALECPTKLYYADRREEYADTKGEDTFLAALAEGGCQVGELAKHYFPGGHDIDTLKHARALAETNALLEQENVVIYEAAVSYGDFFIRVDVLKKEGNRIELIEVKSKSFRTTGEFKTKKGYLVSSWVPYLYDVAFQAWVASQAFPDWEIVPYLMLADKNREATVDGLNQLFLVEEDPETGRAKVKVTREITAEVLGDRILTCVPVG